MRRVPYLRARLPVRGACPRRRRNDAEVRIMPWKHLRISRLRERLSEQGDSLWRKGRGDLTRYVIIGNGTAAVGCIEGIRSVDKDSSLWAHLLAIENLLSITLKQKKTSAYFLVSIGDTLGNTAADMLFIFFHARMTENLASALRAKMTRGTSYPTNFGVSIEKSHKI